jgi:transposase
MENLALVCQAKRASALEKELEALSEQLAWFRRYFLHRKADVVEDSSQQALAFDEAEQIHEEKEDAEELEESEEIRSYKRRKPKRQPLPEDLPRVLEIIDIDEEEKICGCGHELIRIGEEKSEKLDMEPPRLRVIEQIRPKYACRACEGSGDEEKPAVRIAPVPPTLIPGGIATAGLVAYVATAKFVDGLPLYRQEKQFERIGVALSRQTMADWMIAAAAACTPVMEALLRMLRSGPAMLIDETSVQVMREPGRANTQKSYAWAACGGEPRRPVTVFRYEPTRSANVAVEIVGEFSGYVQTDAYRAYGSAFENLDRVIHVGCLAHARRKFTDAANDGKKTSSAREALALIGKIYAVERELKARVRDEAFRTERERRVRPLLEKLTGWLQKKLTQVPPKTALGKAVTYTLEQLPKIERYLECEHLSPDTNRVENAIRPFVVGRKAWLFSGSPRGANASMTLYSLIETAKANKVEPYWYLRRLFDRLPTFDTDDDYEKLLPWRIFSEEAEDP